VAAVSVTVRLKDGDEDVIVAAQDFAVHDDVGLSLYDKPISEDEGAEAGTEVAFYVPGSWVRVRIDGPGT
jgi:hypothetical protein